MARRNGKEFTKEQTMFKTEVAGIITSGLSHIEMEGNREIIVDGCKGILDYENNKIKISANGLVMGIEGDRLNIKAYAEEQIVIEGNILSIDFS